MSSTCKPRLEKTAVLAIALNILLICLAASAAQTREEEEEDAARDNPPARKKRDNATQSFFSNPGKSKDWLPSYKIELKPAEKIRLYIQAGTPDLEQLKMMPSLKGKQREEVVKAYEKWRQDTKPLNEEFNEVRKKMSATLTDRMLSKEEPQMDTMTKNPDFEVLVKARALLQKLRSNRLTAWQEVQAKLTEAQLKELDGLKSGKVPENLIDMESSQ